MKKFVICYIGIIFIADLFLNLIGKQSYPQLYDWIIAVVGFPFMITKDTLDLELQNPILSGIATFCLLVGLLMLIDWILKRATSKT